MSHPDIESDNNEQTLEHLLGVVIENREQRCAEVRDSAREKAADIIRQAYSRGRALLHNHVTALREKYRVRIASATARNQTLMRKQHQKKNQAMLDLAWPMLRQALIAQWDDREARRIWLDAALDCASSMMLGKHWHIEYPADLDDKDLDRFRKKLASVTGKEPRLDPKDDIEAGIRISAHGTVVDATPDGLLQRKDLIQAEIIERVKQRGGNDD